MAFGISFGSKKNKSSSTTNVNKTETGTQVESGAKTSTGVTTSTGSTSTTGSQTGSTTQTGTTSGTTTGQQTSQQTSTQFSDSILSGLESAVASMFGAIPSPGATAFDSEFDHDKFVAAGMDAATNRITTDLNAGLNTMFDQIGGRDDDNSMVTLLANRARGDAESQLAGIFSNLEAQGRGIERENFLANLQGANVQQGFMGTLLNALKGGVASTTGALQTQEATTGTSTQAGTSNLATSEQSVSSQRQVQQLAELLNNILASTMNTVGTETTKGKNKESGFGLGLSI